MTRPFSVRTRPAVIAAMDARAAALGQDRSAYILSLVGATSRLGEPSAGIGLPPRT